MYKVPVLQEEFVVLDLYPSPTSWSDPSTSDCYDSFDMDLLEPQQPAPNFWNEDSWPMPDPSDEVFKTYPGVNRPSWTMMTNFPGSTADMTMAMTAHAPPSSSISIAASHPTATAPDETWTMNPKMDFLTRVLLDEFHDQPGQGQDPTHKRRAPSDEDDADDEDEEEVDDEEEEGDGEEEEEEDGELDDDGSGLYQEHHAEIKPEHARERSDSNATRRATGNNPYGSRGCESCMACRRRKGRCVYNSKEEACEFCARMNHQCGPKVTKVEFQNLQNGKPCPQLRLWEIAKDLEREWPMRDARELYVILGQKLDELEQKRKQLEDDASLSFLSPASSPRTDKVVRGVKAEKRRRTG